jgi:hypothetical protein
MTPQALDLHAPQLRHYRRGSLRGPPMALTERQEAQPMSAQHGPFLPPPVVTSWSIYPSHICQLMLPSLSTTLPCLMTAPRTTASEPLSISFVPFAHLSVGSAMLKQYNGCFGHVSLCVSLSCDWYEVLFAKTSCQQGCVMTRPLAEFAHEHELAGAQDDAFTYACPV